MIIFIIVKTDLQNWLNFTIPQDGVINISPSTEKIVDHWSNNDNKYSLQTC